MKEDYLLFSEDFFILKSRIFILSKINIKMSYNLIKKIKIKMFIDNNLKEAGVKKIKCQLSVRRALNSRIGVSTQS